MISKCLSIGFDFSEGADRTCLTVVSKYNDKLEILKMFYDEEAEELYQRLTGDKLPALKPKEQKSFFHESEDK